MGVVVWVGVGVVVWVVVRVVVWVVVGVVAPVEGIEGATGLEGSCHAPVDHDLSIRGHDDN